jgi:hypothetical protein
MSKEVKGYFSPLTDIIKQIRKYLSDRPLITDLIAKLVITFGVVLIVGGLYLMISFEGRVAQSSIVIGSVTSVVTWVPGIPFYIGVLSNTSGATIGLVSWLIGIDLLFVGLGLWVRHKFALFTALVIFVLGAVFQFVEFLNFGILGSPAAFFAMCIDAIFVLFLFSRFDSKTVAKKQLVA